MMMPRCCAACAPRTSCTRTGSPSAPAHHDDHPMMLLLNPIHHEPHHDDDDDDDDDDDSSRQVLCRFCAPDILHQHRQSISARASRRSSTDAAAEPHHDDDDDDDDNDDDDDSSRQVLCRFCAPDILHPHRQFIGAPPGVPVYALDGSVILKAGEDIPAPSL
jgi:hypothetical protein